MEDKELVKIVREKVNKGRPRRRNLSAEYLTPKGAEREIGIPKKSLANMRYLQIGPPYLKVGSRIFYIKSDLHNWMKSKRIDF
jgi:hypothetical protein